jgi:general secretion pathway protein G
MRAQGYRSGHASRFQQRTDQARGFTLIEMLATMAIMLILAGAALPIARVHAQRLRELELHRDLREIRSAIDRYKDFSDRGMIPVDANTFGYPPDLDTLVNGVVLKGTSTAKYKFLRRIPVDPMTGQATWGMRSMQDDPDSKSWGGEDVFDVYTLASGTALDGTQYSDW